MNSLFAIVLLATTAFAQVTHRPLNIIGYPYLPDLANDRLRNLADFLQDRFYTDTSRRIEILFDLIHYATDTYTPSLVVNALSPSGGYDMQEIDTIILGYLLENNAIMQPPAGVDFSGYTPQTISMVSDQFGTIWGAPTYSCTNLFFSYDSSITGNHNFNDFNSWMNIKRQPGQKGWTGDLSSEPDLRLEYLAGWLQSHPHTKWSPQGYGSQMSQIDTSVVNDVIALRDACHESNNINHCTDGFFYIHSSQWFQDFVNGGTLVLQGFPEYSSDILAAANTDPNNPTKLHTVSTALVGSGTLPFLFTDAWVISKANCDSDCQSTAAIFLTWQKQNWASLISLGQDLSPVRPRFLAVALSSFYSSPAVDALPQFARDYYAFTQHEVNRATALDTIKFWDTEPAQSATLESLITVGYNP